MRVKSLIVAMDRAFEIIDNAGDYSKRVVLASIDDASEASSKLPAG